MRTTTWTRFAIATLAASALGCSDSVTAPTPASTNPTSALPVTPTDPTNAVPGNLGPLHLTGGGFLTEATVTGNGEVRHSWSTTVLAASGPLVEENQRCCRILGDAILQINYGGAPQLGARQMQPPRLVLGGADFRHYGKDDALLMIRDGDLRMLFYVPVKPWALEITGYDAASEGHPGEIRGRITFEAVTLVQDKASILDPTFLRQLSGTTMVSADFVTPMRYQYREITLPF